MGLKAVSKKLGDKSKEQVQGMPTSLSLSLSPVYISLSALTLTGAVHARSA